MNSGEPTVTMSASKEPIPAAELNLPKPCPRTEALAKLTRVHAELERESHEAYEAIARWTAHHHKLGAELTKVRAEMAKLLPTK